MLLKLIDDFKHNHPNFLGIKIIVTAPRNADNSSIESRMQKFVELHKKFPNFIIGFDLVGQEDTGNPLSAYVLKLKEISQDGRFYFHAGETKGFNTDADINLIDAILMNSKRIGHGFSLFKHPVLWAAFKERDIAIEVCPLSNQILHLVHDLRNHPAAFYISENVPIVVMYIFNLNKIKIPFYFYFQRYRMTIQDYGMLKGYHMIFTMHLWHFHRQIQHYLFLNS